MIENGARGSCQVIGLELRHHESLRRSIVLTSQAIMYSSSKSEPRIVVRVPKHDYRTKAQFLAALEASTNKRRSDALASMRGGHGHWSESYYSEMWMARKCDGSKHDVACNGSVVLRDEGNHGIGFTTEPVDEL